MSKISLINTPNQIFNIDREPIVDYCYPIGLLSVSASLTNNGHNVSYLDAYSKNLTPVEISDFVMRQNAEYVGLNVVLPNINVALAITNELKKRNKSIETILGGPATTLFGDELIKNDSVDYIVYMEGEYSTPNLLYGIQQNSLEKVSGIYFKKGRKIIKNPAGPRIKNLDSLPLINPEEIPRGLIKNSKEICIISSRGCPSQCIYCSSPIIWDNKIKFRSVENIFQEIQNYSSIHTFDSIHFLDDNFTLNKRRLENFCRSFKKEGFTKQYNWRCLSRVNTIDSKIINIMKWSGCNKISFGIESASPKILKSIKKNITISQADFALKLTRDVGIKTKAFFMIGFPDETNKEMQKTLDYASTCLADDIAINVVKPYPGTELFNQLSEEKRKKISWKCNTNINSLNKEIQNKMKKYGSLPNESCSNFFTIEELLKKIEKTYENFLNK